MQFNSYIFILAFLPIMLLSFFLFNKISKTLGKLILIAGSIIFYAYMDLKTLIVLAISIAINFLFAKLIERSKEKFSKVLLAIPVVINVGLLLFFKYTNFAISNINTLFKTDIALLKLILPIGISFFTFQQIAYIVAIHRKEIQQANFLDYVSFIIYFPKLLMGPLMDPVDFITQINDDKNRKVNWDNIAYGAKIFSFGLFKKVVLADTFAKAVQWGFDNQTSATAVDLVLIALFYTFEIYFDFSGYSDMATGTSLMFNITLPMNFDSPYKATSIRDFWKRWHMSLTKFLTKYIYIPLGGSKKGLLFTYLNTMIVFLISGIWHGANWTFILWGILHGLLSIFDRIIEKKSLKIFEPFRWLVTFIVTNVLWLLFRADSVKQWGKMLVTILKMEKTSITAGLSNTFSLPEMSLFASFIPSLQQFTTGKGAMTLFIGFSVLLCFLPENNYRNLKKLNLANLILSAIALIWGITCLSAESIFVYFNF